MTSIVNLSRAQRSLGIVRDQLGQLRHLYLFIRYLSGTLSFLYIIFAKKQSADFPSRVENVGPVQRSAIHVLNILLNACGW